MGLSRQPGPARQGLRGLGETPHSSPPASRKQRLFAESAFNRARLAEEWRTVADGAGRLAHRATAVAAWAAAAALSAAGAAALHRGARPARGTTFAWSPLVLTGVRLALAVWRGFRARRPWPL